MVVVHLQLSNVHIHCINKASNIHYVFDAKLRVAREPTSTDKVDDLHNIFQEMLVD
jgi:hypothetical protein